MVPNPKNELFYAVFMGDITETIRVLELGIDPNIKSDSKQAPIHVAISSDEPLIVEALIKFGANINITNNMGNTALHIAISHTNQAMVETLLNLGAKSNISNVFNTFPIHLAASHGTPTIVKLLHYHGADVNVQNNCGTALFLAISRDSTKIAEVLLELGAEINISNRYGVFPVHLAVFYGNIDMLELLYDHGADLDTRDGVGRTALSIAAFYNLKDMAQFLFQQGARSNIPDTHGNLPIHSAVRKGHVDIVKILLTKDTINAYDHNGFTPLHLAVMYNYINIVEILIKYCHTNINAYDDRSEDTAIIMAAKKGYTTIVRLLLEYGADYSKTNNYGQTFAIFAAIEEMRNIVHTYDRFLNMSVDSSLPTLEPSTRKRKKYSNTSKENSSKNSASSPKSSTHNCKSLSDISNKCKNSPNISDTSSPGPTFSKSQYRCGKSSDMLNVSLSEPSVSTLDISLPGSSIAASLTSIVSKFLSTLNLSYSEHNSPEPSRSAKRIRLR